MLRNYVRFLIEILYNTFLDLLPMERMKVEDNDWINEIYLKVIIQDLEEENKTLTKCNLMLQEWLDNKEKVNKSLREENKKLKSDLEEYECSMHFENDEVWFWKREYKRLKKWIKDHCKWYWNLFPEDEMKRQWKKADKKRK